MIDRAAQFSPFAALTGYDAAIKETGRLTDDKIEMDEEALNILNMKFQILVDSLDDEPEVTFTYFKPSFRPTQVGSTAQAVASARAAEAAGAEGLLLLPPYLTECDQAGLAAHVDAVTSAVGIGVIVYNRANARYSAQTVAGLADRHENFIGFKDGVGDIEHLTKVYATNGDRLFYLGGLPTAETFALPLLQLGMSTYSSAMYNFVPEFALEFYRDVRNQDRDAVTEKLNRFVLPYIEIRDRIKGYGVSIVKGGLKAVGRDVGSVRPPLQDLSEQDLADLADLISRAGVGSSATAARA